MDTTAERCSLVETYVAELRTFARPDLFATDIREQRFILRTLQMAVTAALNAALYAVAAHDLGRPSNPKEVCSILAQHGWLSADTAHALQDLIQLRQSIIYDYDSDSVTPEIGNRAITQHLADLLAFVAAVRERLGAA
jgi:uncharacterized protein YutE (UPF0331/DUF86 family)